MSREPSIDDYSLEASKVMKVIKEDIKLENIQMMGDLFERSAIDAENMQIYFDFEEKQDTLNRFRLEVLCYLISLVIRFSAQYFVKRRIITMWDKERNDVFISALYNELDALLDVENLRDVRYIKPREELSDWKFELGNKVSPYDSIEYYGRELDDQPKTLAIELATVRIARCFNPKSYMVVKLAATSYVGHLSAVCGSALSEAFT